MRKNIELGPLLQAARGRWDKVYEKLAPEIADAMKEPGITRIRCPHPSHASKSDGFRFYRDALDTGGGICNTCKDPATGRNGFKDGIFLLRWLKGWEIWRVCAEVAAALGIEGEEMPAPAVRREPTAEEIERQRQEDVLRRDYLVKAWRASVPWHDRLARTAWRYFERRGLPIDVPFGAALRFHPHCYHYDERTKVRSYHPALLAIFCDAKGQPMTFHRTYLTAQGFKAPVREPKKMMQAPSDRKPMGGAIRLGSPANGVLGLAEGLENAVAVHAGTGTTVWAATSSTFLQAFEPPEGIDQIIVWADKDASGCGSDAARRLKLRLWERSIRVMIIEPSVDIPPGEKKIDWNDVWQVWGLEGFRVPEAAMRSA